MEDLAPQAADAACVCGFSVLRFESVGSTNAVVKAAIDDGEGRAVAAFARQQTAGYGRQGRTWVSPKGGMYASFLLRPQAGMAQLPTLSLVCALAVARALSTVAPDLEGVFAVKWPNDVVVRPAVCAAKDVICAPAPAVEKSAINSSMSASELLLAHGADGFEDGGVAAAQNSASGFLKIAGISLELYKGAVCVGIGVNVCPPVAQDADAHNGAPAKNTPVYLADLMQAAGDSFEQPEHLVDQVFFALIESLRHYFDKWESCGFEQFLEEYAGANILTGRHVRVADIAGKITHEGTVEGIATNGTLTLRQPNGHITQISSGEAHLV